MIPLTGTGGLFSRVGVLAGMLLDIETQNATTIPNDAQTIVNQYILAEPLIDGLAPAVSTYQGNAASLLSTIQSDASNTVITMANADVLLPDAQFQTALNLLITEMGSASQTVQSCSVSFTTTPGAKNTTNGQIVVSVKNASGLLQEDAYAEAVQVTVINDAITGSATLGEETLQFAGAQTEPNSLNYDWPLGSGATIAFNAINALDNTSNGILNGSFESFTSNVPNNWTVVTGTPGTTILQSTGVVFAGTSSLEIVGNGTEHTEIQQIPPILPAITQVAVNFWMAIPSLPAAGVLRVALVDGNGNVINDQEGNPNSFSITLSTAATSYTAYSAAFRTPVLMPAGACLDFKLTTALSNTKAIYIDQVGFGAMQQLYTGGPSFSAFSGSDQFTFLDTFVATIANNYGGKFQTMFNRLFNMNQFPALLPSSDSPTISDSLIT